MANPRKMKGTRAETKVARYLSSNGLPTERKPLAGSHDLGDLRTILPDGMEVALEVKAGEQTANPSRGQLSRWFQETLAEGRSACCPSALVIVRFRRTLENAEVWIPNSWFGHGGWTMVHLDEFVDWACSYGLCRQMTIGGRRAT